MKFAVTIDNQASESIPTEPKGEGKEKYYQVTATCDDGIKAEWDYNAWNLKVDNITKGTKCTLAFNSKLTEEDYKNYIEAGVAYRRNTYRGKDITSYLENGKLFTMISSGHFDDIFVGDYIVSPTSKQTSGPKDMNNQTVVWLIADLDNYLYTGQGGHILTKHHATIIPASPLVNAKMNSTVTTKEGYAGSEMYKNTLTTVLNRYIVPDFGKSGSNHLITYSTLVSNSMNENLVSGYAISNDGASNNWSWVNDRQLDLMSEVNAYGTTVMSSTMYDIGIDNRQYAIFKLKPEFINSYGNKRFDYWLKGVVNKGIFTCVSASGASGTHDATFNIGVRPRFLID